MYHVVRHPGQRGARGGGGRGKGEERSRTSRPRGVESCRNAAVDGTGEEAGTGEAGGIRGAEINRVENVEGGGRISHAEV